jgi:hypothetical protein
MLAPSAVSATIKQFHEIFQFLRGSTYSETPEGSSGGRNTTHAMITILSQDFLDTLGKAKESVSLSFVQTDFRKR